MDKLTVKDQLRKKTLWSDKMDQHHALKKLSSRNMSDFLILYLKSKLKSYTFSSSLKQNVFYPKLKIPVKVNGTVYNISS